MACSEKESALREILGEERVDAAMLRPDHEIKALLANKETSAMAERGLSALSLDALQMMRGDSRAAALIAARKEASGLSHDAADLLILAVCARHRLI